MKAALAEIPADACGLGLGEIPAEWRKLLTAALGLRVCPRTFVFSMKREGGDVDLGLSLNVEKAGAELILLEDLEQWRLQGLDVLQAKFPALRKEPEALALLGQALQSMRWGAIPGSGCVRTYVRITGPTGNALKALLKRVSEPHDEG